MVNLVPVLIGFDSTLIVSSYAFVYNGLCVVDGRMMKEVQIWRFLTYKLEPVIEFKRRIK